MVIDIHGHLVVREHLSEQWWDGVAQRVLMRDRRPGDGPIDRSELDRAKEELLQGHQSKSDEGAFLATLDAAGIDHIVLLSIDWGEKIAAARAPWEEQQRFFADLARRHSDRITWFTGVDPFRPRAAELFKQAVEEWGARGLKLHTGAGFYLDDPAVYPLYEYAQKHGLVVLAHTGPEFPPVRSKYGEPMPVDNVAVDFPDLKMIMAHMGSGTAPLKSRWLDDALYLTRLHPNLYVDFGSKQKDYVIGPAEFYRTLRYILDTVPPGKVLFGSDYPYIEWAVPLPEWVQVFKSPDPAVLAEAGVQFTPEELEGVVGRNAAVILGRS